MSDKPRRIDLHPDQFIAGIAGEMSPEELGVYWMVCLLIYSRGGPIEDDADRIAAKFKKCNPRTIRSVLDRLESMSKLHRNESELMANGCRTELEAALKRMRTYRENGLNGGRPSKENNDLAKPSGFSAQNPPAPSISIPPSPSYKEEGKEESISSDSAREPVQDRFPEFYAKFPRKAARRQAEQAWRSALKRADPEIIIAGAMRYAMERTGENAKFTKHPSTWLNADGWLDEPTPINGGHNGNGNGAHPRKPRDIFDLEFDRQLAEYQSRSQPAAVGGIAGTGEDDG